MKATLAQPEANRLFSCSIKDYEELSERVADVARLVKGMEDKQKEYRLGVLLVHGIGRQPSGEALHSPGDAEKNRFVLVFGVGS